MLFDKVIGNVKDISAEKLRCDYVDIEWYEAEKAIIKKTSKNGVEIGIRKSEKVPLHDGDILFNDGENVLIINILECPCIVFKPVTMIEMGKACYEMGNRHAPLFSKGNEVLTPFDEPLMTALIKRGFKVEKRNDKLIEPLGGHGHEHGEHGHTHTHSHSHEQ